MRFGASIILLAISSAGPAFADAQSGLAKFLNMPDEQRAVRESAVADWNASAAPCPTAQGGVEDVAFYKMPTFNSAGMPTSGAWKLKTRWTECGKSKTFSLLYNVTPDGRLSRSRLLPGTTAADPLLQRDGILYAKLAVEAEPSKPSGCKDIRVVDTAFGAYGPVAPAVRPGAEPRSWSESWTVNACGTAAIVAMNFLPNATGTTISAKVDRAARVPGR